jgi:ATP-dependent RNA helicase RhlE
MPKEIATLAGEMLRDPVEVRVTPVATTAEKVAQEAHLIETASKPALLTEILKRANVSRAIVFTRTKRGADKVARHLEARGVPASAIHGNKSQSQRQRALNDFKNGRIKTLVATDIAARGIDVDAVSHVVNFELPDVPEAYVHRIGRTARAGAEGIAISLCAPDERGLLRDIERLTRQALPLIDSRTGAKTPIDANDDTRPERRQQQRPQNGKRQRPAGNAPHHRAAGAPRNGAPNARPARKKTRRPFPQRQSAPA